MDAGRVRGRLSRDGPRPTLVRIAAAACAAVIVAELATWLLRPRGTVIDPAPVSEQAYFSAQEIERGRDFQTGQLALGLGTIAVEGAVLLALVLWRPPAVRRAFALAERRPLLGGAAIGAGISIAIGLAGLPLSYAAHERARDVGLATQTTAPWLGDVAKSGAITAGLAAAGAAGALALQRRLRRRWWIAGAGVVVVVSAVFTWLAPVVLAPVFNRFDPLPEGRPRADVLRLGERAGVDIGEVYRVDASRRSTALNAYVTGLGPTKRVVLYDNLLRRANRGELRSVVAHELAHVRGNDIVRGLAWVAIVAPFGVLFIQLSSEALARRRGAAPGSPSALPALALCGAVAVFVLGSVSTQLSRRVEARADTFALELTQDPRALIEVQRELSLAAVGNPEPPEVVHWLFGTHPTTMERIGAAVRYQRQRAAAQRP